jgi:phosphatidylinositol 4-kinase B
VRRERIHENVLPVTVLSSLVLGSIGVPLLSQHVAPLAVAQARRPRPVEDLITETLPQTQAQKLGRSHTVSGSTSTSRRARPDASEQKAAASSKPKRQSVVNVNGAPSSRTQPSTPTRVEAARRHAQRRSVGVIPNGDDELESITVQIPRKHSRATSTLTSPGVPRRPSEASVKHLHAPKSPASMPNDQKIRLLRQHYFRTETQFLTALEGISSRLVSVPKQARLSALRAELALVAQDLPAEVDVPVICPPTLVDGTASRSKHHRIVRLNPAEATSLNSAEKVPYLLMLELIRDDFDFDPANENNEQLLVQIFSEKGRQRRRLFDTSNAARDDLVHSPQNGQQHDSVLEPANGDLSSASLLQDLDGEKSSQSQDPSVRPYHGLPKDAPRLSMGVNTISTVSLATPRTSEGPISRSSSPGQRPSPYMKPQAPNQADVSALADHMRTASHMLAQLELSAAKRPKAEVAAIKAKIIASMQSLEEQSFSIDDHFEDPSFDSIVAKANEDAAQVHPSDLEDGELETPTDPKLSAGRGADRMENDAKTGGIQRKGDRDDPSAAMFGEAWEQKKERIRRSSPYGWVKNWDLVSVIVKTGADLRQEAFACQLIGVCSKIWAELEVDVWVKNMQILVTGETSGLIETITNAVSLHSIKRSLTLASITAGTNPKKRIATLQDHFAKTFGAADSPAYQKAIDCFSKSLAAYSVISYVLQLKDRHNGNILIDSDGHVVHIDFGFMLSNSPGNVGFEAAPFKLTLEYVEVLGGVEGAAFLRFKDMMKDAFQALRKEAERIVTLVELMGKESKMACYVGGLPSVMSGLRARFVLEKSETEARDWVEDLVTKSLGSYYTRLYDTFQYRTQGIY